MKILILGASFGGMTAAYELRKRLSPRQYEIMVIAKDPWFTFILQRQNAVGLMTLGVRDDDVGRDFQQRQQLGDPSLQT